MSTQREISGFPLSPQQRRLWGLDRRQSPHYRTECAILLEGPLDAERLRLALEGVIRGNKILRTGFELLPGMPFPLQVVNEASVTLDREDEPGGPEPRGRRARVDALFRKRMLSPFDLHGRPALKAELLKLAEAEHLLFLSLPALCMDGVGMGHLVGAVAACYAQGGSCDPGRGVPAQYADVAGWLNDLLECEETKSERVYWQSQDYSPLRDMRLPREGRPRVARPFDPQRLAAGLAPGLAERLERLALRYSTKTSVLLLSAWAILLGRLGGWPDLTVGVLMDGRSYEGLEKALGLFGKFMPVHCRLEGAGVRGLVSQVEDAARDAYDSQEYFDWQGLEGHDGEQQFFPYCFSFEEEPEGQLAGGVRFRPCETYSCFDRFKVKLSVTRGPGGLAAAFHFDQHFLGRGAVEQLAGQFGALLQSMTERPEAAVDDLQILCEDERRFVLAAADGGRAEFPLDRCFHQLFEECAARAPDRVAAVHAGEELTYGELNRRANRLAHHLRELCVGPEVRVGICVQRSLRTLVSMLAVAKAGGAYLPLDPAHQKHQLAFMLKDAEAAVLIVDDSAGELPAHDAAAVSLDADAEAIAARSEENPGTASGPENLAYVLYTSGSTGRPKGVGVEHRQLVNYLHAAASRLSLEGGMSYALAGTFSTDLGHTVIFPSLCLGGTLHLVPADAVLDPDRFAEYMSRHSIDVLKIVPAHLNALLSAALPADVLPRRRLVLGGEASQWELIRRITELGGDCRVFNHYGPTETTVGVLAGPVGGADPDSTTTPLGTPLANSEVHILDLSMSPVGIMMPGEVYVGGANVTRCYLNRPGLTAERFVPSPFGKRPGARLYRTGDMARYLPDGGVEFLGRLDHQVKVRGHRVELGEVEALLLQYPLLESAVVIAREGAAGERSLAAYLVPAPGDSPTLGDLRAFYQERVPDHLMPSEFFLLKRLPLLPNGKVDRKAVPQARALRLESEASFVAPQSEVERQIAEVWRKLLKRERVGLYDNFFDLGGHSLLMVQVQSELRKLFAKDLKLVELFKHPTVSTLSAYVSADEAGRAPEFKSVEDRVRLQKAAVSRRRQRVLEGKHTA